MAAANPTDFVISSQELETENPETVFQLVEKLGEGSYGAVYKGIHKRTGNIVALKIVPIDHDLEELQKEITVMKDCHSPAIVRFYGSFMYKESLWMAIEYCAAGSLADVMRLTRRTMSEAEIGAIVKQLLVGLDYLHKRRKIHRDIKAGNILLTDKCEAKLADFGVAGQLSESVIKRNTVIGTPFWMAPEIIQEVGYGCEADIWSLGITCIELADGRPPYYNIHPMRAIFIIPVKPPPTLENPKLFTTDFNQFIAKCLTKNPAERPNAAALLQEPFIQKAHAKNILEDRVRRVLDLIMQGALMKVPNSENADPEDGTTDPGEMQTIYSTQKLPPNSSVIKKKNTEKFATLGEKFSTMIVNDDEPTQSNSTMMARAVAELKGNPFTTIKPSSASASADNISGTMIKKPDAPPLKPAYGVLLSQSSKASNDNVSTANADSTMRKVSNLGSKNHLGGSDTIKPNNRDPSVPASPIHEYPMNSLKNGVVPNSTIKPPPPLANAQSPLSLSHIAQQMKTSAFNPSEMVDANTMYSQATLKPRAVGNSGIEHKGGINLQTLRAQYGSPHSGSNDSDETKNQESMAQLSSLNDDQIPPPPPALVKSTTFASVTTPEQDHEETVDQLNQLLSMLEKTMESEIQQIRVKYDKKRAPVIDAINAKNNA